MNEMVDRLAAVLAKASGDDWDICLKAPGLSRAGMYRTIARSMIVAMREPTLDMLDAGRRAAMKVRPPSISGMTLEAQTHAVCARENACWRVMIDEALR